jgi:hypothetical protein
VRCLGIHEWGRWSEPETHRSAFSGKVLMQTRQCYGCGKIKARTIAYLDPPDTDGDEIGQ